MADEQPATNSDASFLSSPLQHQGNGAPLAPRRGALSRLAARLPGWRQQSPRLPVRLGIAAVLIALVVAIVLVTLHPWANSSASDASPATIDRAALLHDSRNPVYRTPTGALPTGQSVRLRLRAAAGNASAVALHLRGVNDDATHEQVLPATRVAFAGDAHYDYWQVILPPQATPQVLVYKWLVTSVDHSQHVWYEDHYNAVAQGCDTLGGPGITYREHDADCGYHLSVYAADFAAPEWVKHAVIYQIFVDRFYNGSSANDSLNQPFRYDSVGCMSPFGSPAPGGVYMHTRWSEEPVTPPQGCDFFGGDLQGVIAKLDYLHGLGVNTLYLNPIFMADSNHKYDTTDYLMIDPHFGNLAVWQQLVQKAHNLGMHLILDGVFNHTSSDSIYFDRYHTWQSAGADEVQTSRYEDWYQFTSWPDYTGWFGYDTLPQLTEKPSVRNFIFAGDTAFAQDANDQALRQQYGEAPLAVTGNHNAVATYWLGQGADGWRLDAADQKSSDWWRSFRAAIKAMDPQALLIGEYWGDASQYVLGDQQDGTMNYRFRNAVLGFFAKGGIDPDMGHDSGVPYNAAQFDAHLQTVLESYPPAAVAASMNLLDSHDTARILWELGATPDATPQQVAQAKQTLRLIVQFQMTWPGAPTIYYGDEAGQTQTTYGHTKIDPGDRRTFPWDTQDTDLESWYRQWIAVRTAHPVLQTGAETTLLADNPNHVFAYQRQESDALALVILNADAPNKPHNVTVRLADTVRDGTVLVDAASNERVTVRAHSVSLTVAGDSGRVLLSAAS